MCCRVLCEIFWRSKHRAGGFVELDNQEKAAGQSDDQMKLPPAKPIAWGETEFLVKQLSICSLLAQCWNPEWKVGT